MRRFTNAAWSLAGRVPSFLRTALVLLPDVLLVGGYLTIAYALREQWMADVPLAVLWLGAVPFVAGLIVNIHQYRATRRMP